MSPQFTANYNQQAQPSLILGPDSLVWVANAIKSKAYGHNYKYLEYRYLEGPFDQVLFQGGKGHHYNLKL